MRLTTGGTNNKFVEQSNAMRKLIAFVLVLMVALNIAVLLSAESRAAGTTEKCSAKQTLKIDLRNVNPGLFPSLLKF